jgi:hypothetical protein
VKYFVTKALRNLVEAHDAIIESRVRQTHHANRRRSENDTFTIGDLVYVSTSDLSLPKGRASKLLPKYIGPFKVLDARPEVSSYEIDLPTQLRSRNLHSRFHQSKLRAHSANDDALFPHRETYPYYDYGTPDNQEWLVDEILAHSWAKNELSFQIRWNLGDTTWETYETCKELQALDAYLELMGVGDPLDLPRRKSDQ